MRDFLPIEKYVPHRGAMLLLERLLDAGEEHAIAQVRVPRDGMFVAHGVVPAWVGIEYMAQTVAAWAGWQAVCRNEPVKIGFLLGSRRYEALCPSFAAGSTLRVEVRCELLGSNGLGMFDCQVWDGDVLSARAKISVYEPENGAAYLQELAAEAGGGHE